MKRYFNTEGCCLPDEHYMVKLEERMKRIKESYVDRGKYFVISKGRQYGKTTTLKALENYLSSDYLVSAICKYLDEEVSDTFEFEDAADVWTKRGIAEAVKLLLTENSPLLAA